METGKILQSDYLDIIFDNRNKKYGGYELRKHYNRRALRALGITCTVILLGIGIPFMISRLGTKDDIAVMPQTVTDVILSALPIDEVKPLETPKPPVETAAPPATAETVKNLPPVVEKDNNVDPANKPPDTKDLSEKMSGPVTSPDQGGSEAATSTEPANGAFGNGHIPGGDKAGGNTIVNEEPVRSPDEMPEFPGGMKALSEFIRNNLRYPAAAREDGIEGRVVITFVVNAQGVIESAKIGRGIGGGCDKEALRVVNAMPKWKPGKMGGHNVKVYYTLPISFKLT